MAEELVLNDEISQRRARLQARRLALPNTEKAEFEKLIQGSPARVISTRPRDVAVPLSFSQERLWFLDQLEPGRPVYNIPFACRLSGDLHEASLHQSLNETVRRHESLRTTFSLVNDRPVQTIGTPKPVMVPVINLQRLAAEEKQKESKRLIGEEAAHQFDLARGPLLRALLLRLADADHILAITTHHIVSDGWSFHLWMSELAELYKAFSSGLPSSLPELQIQFADYAVWQRRSFDYEKSVSDLAYWKQQLQSCPPLTDLPTDHSRPPVRSLRGATANMQISSRLTAELNDLSRREGVTLFTTLLAALNIVLARYSGQNDIVVGIPIADRQWTETEALIGLFVNTLALHTTVEETSLVSHFLTRQGELLLDAQTHREVPFERLVEELRPERTLSHSPIFQVMFAFQNVPRKHLDVEGLSFSAIDVDAGVERFDITLSVSESANGLDCSLSYSTDLFERPTAERILIHFLQVLETIAISPEKRLNEISFVSPSEHKQVISEWNDTFESFPAGCIHEYIEESAVRTPDAVAVESQDHQLSYLELSRRSNQLAHYLRNNGAGPEVPVAICMERSIDLLIGLLGIMKAGAAYVPLDPGYPRARIAFMLEDTKAPLLVVQEKFVSLLPISNARLIRLDADWITISKEADTNPSFDIHAENLIYIIYTSGSTGRPKGAMNTHGGLSNRLNWMQKKYTLTADDSILQKTPFSFDVSVWELFWPLMAGARVVMARPGGHQDPAYLANTIEERRITTIHFVPSMLRAFLSSGEEAKCSSLQRLICSGESLDRDLSRECQRLILAELHNLYGPTEASVDVTHWKAAASSEIVLIGGPISNIRVYVLDANMKPLSVHIGGELYLGGAGLGRGYFHQPTLTAEKFVPNPFGLTPGERLYQTGDWVRWRTNGNLEYLGRRDGQIKHRGNRIELGEIEVVLRRHAQVHDAAVLIRQDGKGEPKLTAYVVAANEHAIVNGTLRRYLQEHLPEYMIPELFVPLDELPLTPAGKLDRQALPQLEESRRPSNATFAPTTLVQEVIAVVWADVLGVQTVSKTDNFFDLGGHSLLVIQVIVRLQEVFQTELPVRSLFESPTLDQFAEQVQRIIQSEDNASLPPLCIAAREGAVPLSYAQQRLWFLDRLIPNSNAYNIPVALRLDRAINLPALEQSLDEIGRRHEILRTTISNVAGQLQQVIRPFERQGLPFIDLGHIQHEDRERETTRISREEMLRPFALEVGPLMRSSILRLETYSHLKLLTMHHIISDGWSMGVFVQEMQTLYAAFAQGLPSPLEELNLQYADYAGWQRSWLKDDVFAAELRHWKLQLADAPTVIDLPADYRRPLNRTLPGAHCPIVIPEEVSRQLKEFGRHQRATTFMILMAGFHALLARYIWREDILVGTPMAGRSRVEFERLIGFFVNMVVLRTSPHRVRSFSRLLAQVRENSLTAFAHQDFPFDKLVEALDPPRSLGRNPLFQVVLAFQNAPMPGTELAGITLPSGSPGGTDSKFDLEAYFWDSPKGIEGTLVYSPELFKETTVSRMARQLLLVIENGIASPDTDIFQIPLNSGREYCQIVEEWNQTDAEFPNSSISEIYEEQVRATPDTVALEFASEQITYAELNQRADLLANHLSQQGVERDTFVGVLIERSVDLVVALLAICKAGGAYVPLNTNDPPARIAFILRDAGSSIVLTTQQMVDRLPTQQLNVICLDSPGIRDEMPHSGFVKILSRTFPDDLAYMMYTSGSTGAPKGVCITHRNILRLVKGSNYARLDSNEVFLQFAPVSFDASTFEIWGCLLNGGRLCLFSSPTWTPTQLGDFITSCQITTAWLTAGLFHQMVDSNINGLKPLRQLLAGGEALSSSHVRKAIRSLPECHVINGYGPTETTTFACCYLVEDSLIHDNVPIGRPISNTKVYLLNDAMTPVAIGEVGELWIAGEGLGRGYLNSPDLTAERFRPNAFSPSAAGRLYKTGDLARYRDDGNIEFLGRLDNQVKLRGFRIELGEIENALIQHPEISQAVALLREDIPGEKWLVAYIIANTQDAPTSDSLKRYLAERLPDYMVPIVCIAIPTVPLTANGKIDRTALPIPDRSALRSGRMLIAAKDSVQSTLVTIWEELLAIHPIGIQDDFFELGGHSLLAVQLIARIEERLGKRLPVAALFQQPTIEHLSRLLREDTSIAFDSSVLVPIQPNGQKPKLFCIHAAGGQVFCYSQLARHLGLDQPFYGVQANINKGSVPHIQIEPMAAEYVTAIRAVQPTGPYFIGGWSMGGIIAFEMARQFSQQNQQVALLALMDTEAPSDRANEYNWVVLLGSFATDLGISLEMLRSSWSEIFSLPPMIQLSRIWAMAKRNSLISSDMTLLEFRKLFDSFKTNAHMMRSYKGGDYDGMITLFHAEEPIEYIGAVAPKDYYTDIESTKGWKNFTRQGVDVRTVAGQHYTMIQEPHVKSLAAQLSICIEKAIKERG